MQRLPFRVTIVSGSLFLIETLATSLKYTGTFRDEPSFSVSLFIPTIKLSRSAGVAIMPTPLTL